MLALTSDIQTPFHRLRAGWKLAALSLSTVGLFALQSPLWLAGAAAVTAGFYLTGGAQFARLGLRMLRPLWLVLALILLWHVVTGDWARGAAICLRLGTAVALANLVTLTTKLSDMIDVLMWLLSPLRKLGLRTAPLALAIALVVRFVPVLGDRARSLTQAWKARSTRPPAWRIVLPLTLSALDDADHVAEALRARGGVAGDFRP